MTGRRLSCAVVFLMLVAAPAASAKTWTAENMAIPQVAQGQLFSVSCGAPNACEAVGQTVDARGNTKALAEHWNGTSWTRQSIPSVDGPVTSLSSVSCTSSEACLAVGSYSTNTSSGMVAERWNGHAWTLQLIPDPEGRVRDPQQRVVRDRHRVHRRRL